MKDLSSFHDDLSTATNVGGRGEGVVMAIIVEVLVEGLLFGCCWCDGCFLLVVVVLLFVLAVVMEFFGC